MATGSLLLPSMRQMRQAVIAACLVALTAFLGWIAIHNLGKPGRSRLTAGNNFHIQTPWGELLIGKDFKHLELFRASDWKLTTGYAILQEIEIARPPAPTNAPIPDAKPQ